MSQYGGALLNDPCKRPTSGEQNQVGLARRSSPSLVHHTPAATHSTPERSTSKSRYISQARLRARESSSSGIVVARSNMQHSAVHRYGRTSIQSNGRSTAYRAARHSTAQIEGEPSIGRHWRHDRATDKNSRRDKQPSQHITAHDRGTLHCTALHHLQQVAVLYITSFANRPRRRPLPAVSARARSVSKRDIRSLPTTDEAACPTPPPASTRALSPSLSTRPATSPPPPRTSTCPPPPASSCLTALICSPLPPL